MKAIRAVDIHAKVVIVTAVDGEAAIYRGLRAGAKGYVLKQSPDQEIVGAVLATMAGKRYLAPSVAAKSADRVNSTRLSSRELEILWLMARGLSNKGIARQAGMNEGTVKFHVNYIPSKLKFAVRTEAVGAALQRGLIQLPS